MSKKKSVYTVGDYWLREPTATRPYYRICWSNNRTGVSTRTADFETAKEAIREFDLKNSTAQHKDEPVMASCARYDLLYAHKLRSQVVLHRAMKRTMDILGKELWCSKMDSGVQLKLINAWRAGERGEFYTPQKRPLRRSSDGTIDKWLAMVWAAMNYSAETQHLAASAVPARIGRKRWNPNFGRAKAVLKLEDVAKLLDAAVRVDSDVPTVKLLPPDKKYRYIRLYWSDPRDGKTHRPSTWTTDPVVAETKRLERERAFKAERTIAAQISYGPAWRFAIIKLGTGGRSEAVCDLSKTSGQINFEHHILDQNPPGRQQTNKYRSVVKMAPTLEGWLHRWEPATESGHYIGARGKRIRGGRNIFRNLVRKAGIKATPRMLRTFVGTWLATHGVPTWERDMFMGHRKPTDDGSQTGIIYTIYEPQYLRAAADAIEALFQALAPLLQSGANLLNLAVDEDQPLPDEDVALRLLALLTPPSEAVAPPARSKHVAERNEDAPARGSDSEASDCLIEGLDGGPCRDRTYDQLIKSDIAHGSNNE